MVIDGLGTVTPEAPRWTRRRGGLIVPASSAIEDHSNLTPDWERPPPEPGHHKVRQTRKSRRRMRKTSQRRNRG